jgi:sulfur-oxidizing protein SoxZ
MVRVLINLPKQIHADVPFEVKLLISHPMESGYRRDAMGQRIPRDIIQRLVCAIDGETVLDAGLFPAIAANPFFAFTAVAAKSGTLTLTLTGDNGLNQTETAAIIVV